MEQDTIKDLKLILIIYKVLAFIMPALIIFIGIYASLGQSSFNGQSFIPNEVSIGYFLIVVVIAIVVSISLYAKGLSYSYKICLLEDMRQIKESLKKEGK